MKKIVKWLAVVIITAIAIVGVFYIVYVRPFMNHLMEVRTVQYDKNFTVVLGGGGNSGILVSDSLVLVIDTKMKDAAKQFYNTVKQLAGSKPIVIVNTHIHNDHTEGNQYFKGAAIIAGGNYDKAFWVKDAGENTLPTQWIKDSLMFVVGDDTACIYNLPGNAHTQSDIVVYLKKRKVLFTGDLVLNKQAPALFGKYSSSSEGYLTDFNWMEKNLAINTVIPGHGTPGGTELIDNFRQYFEDMQAVATGSASRTEVMAHYENWAQIPFMMSPGATISYIKDEKK